MTRRTNTTNSSAITKQDIADLIAVILDANGVAPKCTPRAHGFIIVKKQNTSGQYFFSDHQPVDGIDTFGHSTKDKARMVREAYKYEDFEDALQDLATLCSDDAMELVNDTIESLGIYDVDKDKMVFTMALTHDFED